MVEKKGVTILIIIALILAIIAISINFFDLKEVPTSFEEGAQSSGSGEIGVNILPPVVEDKLTNEPLGEQT